MDIDLTDKLHKSLDMLIDKHKTNEYVFGRLVNYIENLLPVALATATEVNKQREARRTLLSANQEEFTTRFLQKNHYFYSPPTELFLHYDGFHFVIRNEEDIYHQILSTITAEKCLREWRHKVNKNIIKRIKERSPLTVIPESITIQFVLNTLCPSIFKTRNHAKYFLSIVGECLFKKKQWDLMEHPTSTPTASSTGELIYIFPPRLKDLMREINNQCYTIFGLPNIFTNIKFKYYDHNYNQCRLISIAQKKIEIPPMLIKHMLDFLCVAAHYHLRYGSSDKFLQQCIDYKLVEHALFLSKNTPESIVNIFTEKSLTVSTTSIDTKNMLFIWKKFLDERNIPNIIFYETLKQILKKKLPYNETKDAFAGLTSIHLPNVSLFMRFWEETIDTDVNDWELEIDEICVLFKHWTNNTKTINEGLVLELIQHFYPETVIENNKYILHTSCKLWDKYNEVVNSIKLCKTHYTQTMEAIEEPYAFYSSQCKNKYNLLVSKRYFEKVAADNSANELDLVFQ